MRWKYIVTLFIIIPKWKQPKSLATLEWINKLEWNKLPWKLFSNNNGQDTDTHNNTGESQMYFPKWKKPDLEGYITWYDFYNILEKTKL